MNSALARRLARLEGSIGYDKLDRAVCSGSVSVYNAVIHRGADAPNGNRGRHST
jgi:hypothetical protein